MQNDIDIVFHLEDMGATSNTTNLHLVREVVYATIAQFLPPNITSDKQALAPFYLSKMFLKSSAEADSDAWALFSFAGFNCPGLDIKFVCSCARPYQFSMDSLFVVLDDVVLALQQSLQSREHACEAVAQLPIVHSYYGDAEQVKQHIISKTVSLRQVSDLAVVHGGGLFKYASLVSKGWTVAPELNKALLEKYACNRFSVDFPDFGDFRGSELISTLQAQRLNTYLHTHYRSPAQSQSALVFLQTLRDVVTRASDHNCCRALVQALSAILAPMRPIYRPTYPSRAGRPANTPSHAHTSTVAPQPAAPSSTSTSTPTPSTKSNSSSKASSRSSSSCQLTANASSKASSRSSSSCQLTATESPALSPTASSATALQPATPPSEGEVHTTPPSSPSPPTSPHVKRHRRGRRNQARHHASSHCRDQLPAAVLCPTPTVKL